MQKRKHKKPLGVAPAIALVNPKFPHNVGAVLRAASCWGMEQVWFTGRRVSLTPYDGYRLPREERLKGYKAVDLRNDDRFFDHFDKDVVPVAIEIREGSEMLQDFEHPEKALYVFGPEDGSLGKPHVNHCHRFLAIPTHFCLNLSAAVNVILYDRRRKRMEAELEPALTVADMLKEERGFISNCEHY